MTSREQLIDAVFDLNRYPTLGEEQCRAVAERQGALSEVQARHLAVLRAIRPLVAELGQHVASLPEDAELSKQLLEDYVAFEQLTVASGTVEDEACNLLRTYLLGVHL